MLNIQSNIDDIKYVDIKDSRHILIRGWAFVENKLFYDFKVEVNNKSLPFKLKKVKRPDVQSTLHCQNLYTGFLIRINLNDDCNLDTVKISITLNEESKEILTLNKSELEEIKDTNPIMTHVDHFFYDKNNDCADVYGFALSKAGKPLKIKITNENSEEIKFKNHKIKRADLVKHYIVNEEDVECGFNLLFEDFNPESNYMIHFESNGFSYSEPLVLESNYMAKSAWATLKANSRYILNNGFLYFYLRKRYGCSEDSDYNSRQKLYAKFIKEKGEEEIEAFSYKPRISIVVATYNTPIEYLDKMIESVTEQTYQKWELIIADGSSTNKVMNHVSNYWKLKDGRIRIIKLEENLGIAENMNAAIKESSGDYIALYDHDDFLDPYTLDIYVKSINENKNTRPEILYCDEDKVDSKGKIYFQPNFKPDFNLDLLHSGNYITHFLMVSRQLIEKVGLLDSQYDGAQDYDFVLRCVENVKPNQICHIPFPLYHWRMHKDSTAGNPQSKMYAYEAGVKALQAHYDRLGIPATASQTNLLGNYRTHYTLKTHPKVSIIIPNKDNVECLSRCLESIIGKTSYDNYEIVIVENNSADPETYEYYAEVEEKYDFVKVVYHLEKEFNISAILNYGAEKASGRYLLFMHNDVEVISEDFIEEMLGYCMRKDVGAVGCRIYNEDDSIQSAGIVLGHEGEVMHCFQGYNNYELSYQNRLFCAQDYTTVSGVCLMTASILFEHVGGFNEDLKAFKFDIEYCLKLQRIESRVVYTPFAEVMHRQLRSPKNLPEYPELLRESKEAFKKFWEEFDLSDYGYPDPNYNDNLTLIAPGFELKKIEEIPVLFARFAVNGVERFRWGKKGKSEDCDE